MVYRLFVEKKVNHEAAALQSDIQTFLSIPRLVVLRLLNRYDVEGIGEEQLSACVGTVFSEPPLDRVSTELPEADGVRFAVEYLPGQFDQRADSAAQCVQLVAKGERPLVRTARVFLLEGPLTEADVLAIKRYVINPVESREASLEKPETLAPRLTPPEPVRTLTGFTALTQDELHAFHAENGLAMDLPDLLCCQQYFLSEKRDPTETEIRVIDTYWSDHCRHTTFLTEIANATFDDPLAQAAFERYIALRKELGIQKPITLMDMATIGAKHMKRAGKLDDLDESDEVNACTLKIEVDVNGKQEPWLLLFKNETHNHPTEIEPFGGAATCIGGAIRDPLSGRAYVYQAMRVTGAANPLKPMRETIPGKLPQKQLTTTAAAGFSAYGNQIGLATGLVDEVYHDGYAAKRMEIGAVVGAAPAAWVRREVPTPGDVIVLVGGRTGRDGCGGATGSSKSHTKDSLAECGAEVQKGNAPEERKLQRLFRNPDATRLIKRCNDFGAGGVAVAIGELADGLRINLGQVPKKYEGLTGTELAISESQERMAVVLAREDVETFLALAQGENLAATAVAEVMAEPRLVMEHQGKEIVSIARAFLDTNGAPKSTSAHVPKTYIQPNEKPVSLGDGFKALALNLNVCGKRGLSERFDATIGAGSVLMPFGGRRQMTPVQAMAAKIPVLSGETNTCSAMAYGFSPHISEQSPFQGAYLAVVESLAKLVATGAGYQNARLTFQEYFERMRADRWWKPVSAMLGALSAQLDLGIPAIGGKDSMSGSFEGLDVPPTLVSFAVTTANADDIISPEFKRAGSRITLLLPDEGPKGLMDAFEQVTRLIHDKKVVSAYAIGSNGAAEGLLKMGFGNRIGFTFAKGFDALSAFDMNTGAFLLETEEPVGTTIGHTTEDYAICAGEDRIDLSSLEALWSERLESVFPTKAAVESSPVEAKPFTATKWPTPAAHFAKPRVLIPVFPGTNCEYDTAKAFQNAGAEAEIFVLANQNAREVAESVERFVKRLSEAQILMLPGGFSSGDEPDGSGKFIAAFLRSPRVRDALTHLLNERGGLVGGICNGFQALIKVGLLPFGEIREPSQDAPTLTYNAIGRHQSRLVETRITSNLSPWLMLAKPGDVHMAPISHGEGRFVCGEALLHQLIENGQIATQYVDLAGDPTMDILFNPSGSLMAVEGITSPGGRVFGRMAHAERVGKNLNKNVPGDYGSPMFRGAVAYFR